MAVGAPAWGYLAIDTTACVGSMYDAMHDGGSSRTRGGGAAVRIFRVRRTTGWWKEGKRVNRGAAPVHVSTPLLSSLLGLPK